jgi:site-specific DNA recombinase
MPDTPAANGPSSGAVRTTPSIHCAIYTRKSTEEGLEQDFNTLDAQRDAAQSFIASQRSEGWTLSPTHYDDGGYTGAHMDRPALQQLLTDVRAGLIHCVVVYKVDRLTRSLLDFSRIIDVLDRHNATFVSVTQQFNTTSSLGRLTLNILLSFAQFERDTISERTRDKMSAARRRGKWTGGHLVLGYDLQPGAGGLVINLDEAETVRKIFHLYQQLGSLLPTVQELRRRDWRMKQWVNRAGQTVGGGPFTRTTLHVMLTNPVYAGQIRHRGKLFPGEHDPILDPKLWQQVQQHLARRGAKGAHQPNRYGALLLQLVHCATCDAGMTHTWSRRNQTVYRYYTCIHSIHHGAAVCRSRSVSAPALEQAVVQQLQLLAEPNSELQPFLSWEHLTVTQREKTIAQFVKRVSFDGRTQTITLALHQTNETNHAE